MNLKQISNLVELKKQDGSIIDPTALTNKIIEKVLAAEPSLDSSIASLTLQEGVNSLFSLSKDDLMLSSALTLQPQLLDYFLLMYQIGVLTGVAIFKNKLTVCPVNTKGDDASDTNENNSGSNTDSGSDND